ncbi:MAG: XRE family transcriptional regulator [Candidatus Competibacteraceae bacterium]|nr:MAG: XRE family transcriptional regulator [Candidatus Competibacteraceae bacterium]
MNGEHPPSKPRRDRSASVKPTTAPEPSSTIPVASETPPATPEPSLVGRLSRLPGSVAGAVTDTLRKVTQTAETPWRVGKALLLSPEQTAAMKEAGEYVHDLRQVAGLTLDDLDAGLGLKDVSLLAAVEKGTAALSFDLILRLAAVLARRDPVPVVMRLARVYRPDLWRILEDWGIGRLSLHIERERQFINIYRRHDLARGLSDAGFAEVLSFTQHAFEMALRLTAAQEGLDDRVEAGDA